MKLAQILYQRAEVSDTRCHMLNKQPVHNILSCQVLKCVSKSTVTVLLEPDVIKLTVNRYFNKVFCISLSGWTPAYQMCFHPVQSKAKQ